MPDKELTEQLIEQPKPISNDDKLKELLEKCNSINEKIDRAIEIAKRKKNNKG